MVRKTMKMLLVALIAAFAMSSVAEAATPTKTRHRTKHSSRVASGAPASNHARSRRAKKPAASTTTRAKASGDGTRSPRRRRRPRSGSRRPSRTDRRRRLSRRLTPARQTPDDRRNKGEDACVSPGVRPCLPSRCSSTSAPPGPPPATSPDTVKAGGTAALTDAERRADQARYQEVTCRSALNRVEGHAVQLDAQPVPRLHARLPLLLRAPLSRRSSR